MNNRKIAITLALALLCGGAIKGQEAKEPERLQPPQPYQSGFVPRSLGEGVNTSYPEVNPFISNDGQTLYFTRANHPQNSWGGDKNQDIWYSTLKADGTWSEAERLPNNTVNMGRNNAIFGLLEDGSLVINGRYSNGIFSSKKRRWVERGMSRVNRSPEGVWSRPERLKIAGYSSMNRGETSSAYVTPDGKYIFMAFSRAIVGDCNKLFVSKRKANGKYSRPKVLKFENNSLKMKPADAPFIAVNDSVLYFGAKDANGKHRICKATPKDSTFRTWVNVTELSDTINSENYQNYMRMNRAGSWAYFAMNKESNLDLYRVKIFEEFPYIRLHGSVINKKEQTPMLKDTSYVIEFEGGQPSLLTINKDEATYEMHLPFGFNYLIKPQMEGWIGQDFTFDATDVHEFVDLPYDIQFESIPFVRFKGKLLNARTGQPLRPDQLAVVLVNGQRSDSVRYDREAGTYDITLPLGMEYKITSRMPHYKASETASIDARNLAAYVEKEVDFNFKSNPYVRVSGKMLDNVTFAPITGEAKPKLMVDGKVVDSVKVNAITGEYSVCLPFGKVHKTAVSSKQYKPLDNPLDLSSYNEFAEVKHNIYGENKFANMATLSGKIINMKTGLPLEPGIKANLKVNGTELEHFKYDSTTATYEVKLTVGALYDIMPAVKNFYNKYEQVDLTKVKKGAKVAKNFYVTPIEVGQSVNIDFIYFDTGKWSLKPKSFRSLNALVEFLKEYPNVIVEIGGHTDNQGSKATNQRLSENRAKSVADFILGAGIDPARITSKGYNFEKPKESNKTAKGREANRRVEFTIVGI